MSSAYTIMVVPSDKAEIKSFKVTALIFRSFFVLLTIGLILTGILAYNYWRVLSEVYQHKYLTLENKQLKEQIQLFQMKITALNNDFQRIEVMEKKLRVITGLEKIDFSTNEFKDMPKSTDLEESGKNEPLNDLFNVNLDEEIVTSNFKTDPKFLRLKKLYSFRISSQMGQLKNQLLGKNWSRFSTNSDFLADDFASFDYKFMSTKEKINQLEESLNNLDIYLLDKHSMLQSTPTILPTEGWVTSYFGPRISPYSNVVKMHEGIDVGASIGTNILATADGVVTFSGNKAGYGKYVQINHGYGVETVYAHASKTVAKTGQVVKRGDIIAKVGNTGYSTGPHLHYEVRVNGTSVDPLYFILVN